MRPAQTPIDPVRRYFAFNACAFSLAWIPVMYPYFTVERGFDKSAFFELNAIYYLTMCLFEVPTGVLADRIGRKRTLVAGAFGFAISFVVIFGAHTLPGAMCGMVLMGIAHTLLSGADAAWLYDTLHAQGRGAEYLSVEGRAQWVRILGISVSDVLGGLAVHAIGYGAAFAVSIAATAGAGVIALGFAEPRRERQEAGPLRHLADSFRVSIARVELRWLLLYTTLVFVLLRVAFHFYQPRLHEIGVRDGLVYGAVIAALNLVAAPFARFTHVLERRFGERALAASLPLSLGASFLLLGVVPGYACVALFALQQMAFGVMTPLTRSMTNRVARPMERATLLSVQSFSGRLVFGVASIFIGESFQRSGATTPIYMRLGVIAIAGGAALFFLMPARRDSGA